MRFFERFRRRFVRVGDTMRGRVSRVSVLTNGEISVSIRCGMEDPILSNTYLRRGALVEFGVVTEREGAAAPQAADRPPARTVPPPAEPLEVEPLHYGDAPSLEDDAGGDTPDAQAR